MAATALCCVLGMLAGALHHLVAPHSVCAEHGETIDAPPPALLQAPAPDATQLEAPPAGVGAEQHDHCASLGHRRAGHLAGPSSRLARPPSEGLATSAGYAGRVARTSVPLLALAPKVSPPTV